MHRVVALTAPGIAPFELGCVVEVFGLRRPELDVPWWYELRVAAETPGPLPPPAGGRGRGGGAPAGGGAPRVALAGGGFLPPPRPARPRGGGGGKKTPPAA